MIEPKFCKVCGSNDVVNGWPFCGLKCYTTATPDRKDDA